MCCDTDSFYLAINGASLDDIVKPELHDVFRREKKKWLPENTCSEHAGTVSDCLQPASEDLKCCWDVYCYSKRTPGLWKLEGGKTGMLCLNPKTYILMLDGDTVKMSAKGIQKKINPLTADDFEHALSTGEERRVLNRGIRQDRDNVLRAYELEKRGLTGLYIKREILEDGSSTRPLKTPLALYRPKT